MQVLISAAKYNMPRYQQYGRDNLKTGLFIFFFLAGAVLICVALFAGIEETWKRGVIGASGGVSLLGSAAIVKFYKSRE
jgi:hypothetical protein